MSQKGTLGREGNRTVGGNWDRYDAQAAAAPEGREPGRDKMDRRSGDDLWLVSNLLARARDCADRPGLPSVIAVEARTAGPVSLHAADASAVQLADGSLRAVLECPTLPVARDGSRATRTSAACDALGRHLGHPLQLVVQRRCGQHAASQSECGGDVNAMAAPSRLRDSYERLLADLWPDRRTALSLSRLADLVRVASNPGELEPAEASHQVGCHVESSTTFNQCLHVL
jgi:hypothetical protein